MKPSTDQHGATEQLATLDELVATIADSPIVVGRPAVVLPEGFEPIDVAIQRGNDILEKQVKPELQGSGFDEYGSVGWQPEQTVAVTELVANMPAVQAGIQLKDQIVAINGTPMHSVFAIIHYLQQNGAKPVDVTVLRDGARVWTGPTGDTTPAGLIRHMVGRTVASAPIRGVEDSTPATLPFPGRVFR